MTTAPLCGFQAANASAAWESLASHCGQRLVFDAAVPLAVILALSLSPLAALCRPATHRRYEPIPTGNTDSLRNHEQLPARDSGTHDTSLNRESRSVQRSRSRVSIFASATILFAAARAAAAVWALAAEPHASLWAAFSKDPGPAISAALSLILALLLPIAALCPSPALPPHLLLARALPPPILAAARSIAALALAAVLVAPADLRLLWIECATPSSQQLCTNPSSAIASAISIALALPLLAASRMLLNEHRFRAWLLSGDRSSPELRASFWSKATFSWFDDIITLGFDRPLETEDIAHLIHSDTSEAINAQFELSRIPHWSLLPNLCWFAAPLVALQAIYSIISAFLVLLSPFLLREILKFAQDPSSTKNPHIALLYALALFAGVICRSIADGQMYFLGRRIGLRLRAIIIMLVYKKSLRTISHSKPVSTDASNHAGPNNDTANNTNASASLDARANSGKIVNLMSFDAVKILEASCYVMYLWMTPIEAVICTAFLVAVTGMPGLAGAVVMTLMVPASARIGQLVAHYQKNLMTTTDLRITAINELLQGIQIVKLFAWEPRFSERIRSIRELELERLWKYISTFAISRMCWTATPIFVSFMTFFSMSYIMNRPLDAPTVFTALALFNALKMPLTTFPDIIVKVIEALVSLRRIETYLNEPEIPPTPVSLVEDQSHVQITGNASFSWHHPGDGMHPTRPDLRKLALCFPRGKLTVICGSTGAGKSSLLLALLGELHTLSGGVHLGQQQYSRGRSGHAPIAFAGQQIWLQNATIRDNIIFGNPFDPVRYAEVLRICALIKDLQVLDGGDSVEVGERGVNLSGGQKARISLARACYSDSPLVLLDDPLSAVDAPTARHLFEECVCGPLMSGRTRLLVTHAEALCIPRADMVVRISGGTARVVSTGGGISAESEPTSGSDPSVTSSGTIADSPQATVSATTSLSTQGVITSLSEATDVIRRLTPCDGSVKRLTINEARTRGSVSLDVYWAYINAAGSVPYIMFVIVAFVSAQAMFVCYDLWLKVWADAYRHVGAAEIGLDRVASSVSMMVLMVQNVGGVGDVGRSRGSEVTDIGTVATAFSTNATQTGGVAHAMSAIGTVPVNVYYYLGVYGLIGICTILFFFIRIISIAIGSLRASRELHMRLVDKLLRAPIQFFEKTPMGRILNRFSKDIKDIDQEVGLFTGEFFSNMIATASTLIVILAVTPRTIIGIVPVAFGYAAIGLLYLRSSRELKRLDSTTRSPIFSHFSETISGASTIRAYAAQDQFIREAHQRVDDNHINFLNLWISNRWLGIRVDFSGAMVTLASSLSIVFSVVFDGGINAGLAGLSLSYALSFSESLLWLIRMHALMEMEIVSVERVQEYLSIEEEAPAIIASSRPPHGWPAYGEIRVDQLTIRYTPTAVPVLDHVSFTAHMREKIAIVGRTGAGKTTLSIAFFRFIEFASGRILIDGVDISRIGLHDLRSRLCVIPQTPVLFTGTLRTNLDPFGQYSDAEIWAALKQSHFLESVEATLRPRSDSSTLLGVELVGGVGDHAVHRVQTPTPTPVSNTCARSIISIDAPVTEGGANYSQGQRQLLCLARALLQSSRVIILDEATASVDHDTDTRIQRTIRDEFKHATLLTIAHRLRTIIDYDKVLVLDKGRVAQFGTPFELLSVPDGLFHQMCVETGEFDHLVRVARDVHLKRVPSNVTMVSSD